MSKLIPKHQTPSQPLVLSQDNTRVEHPYIESIPITETNLYKQYLADPYKNSDFNTWKKRQELIQSNRKDEKVKADNRSSKVKEQETKQGEAIYSQKQRKELESKVNKGIWTGIGLGGLALAQATPAAPYIDAAFATHGALGLAKQADKGTLGWNGETALNTLQVLPFGVKGVRKIQPIVTDGYNAVKDVLLNRAYTRIPVNKTKYYRAFHDLNDTKAINAIQDLHETGIVRANPNGTQAGTAKQYYIGPYFYKGNIFNSTSKPKAVIEGSEGVLDWLPIKPHEPKLIPAWNSNQFTPLFNGVPNSAPIENFILYQKGTGPFTKRLWYKTPLNQTTSVNVKPFHYGKDSNIMVHSKNTFGSGTKQDPDYLVPGKSKIAGQDDYIWFNKEQPYTMGVNGKRIQEFYIGDESVIPGLQHVRSSTTPIGQWNGSSGFVRESEYVTNQRVPKKHLLHFIWDDTQQRYKLVSTNNIPTSKSIITNPQSGTTLYTPDELIKSGDFAKGKEMAAKFFEHPVVQNSYKHNQELAKRFGITIPDKQAAEVVKQPVQVNYRKLDGNEIAQVSRRYYGDPDTEITMDWSYYPIKDLRQAIIHENLHRGWYSAPLRPQSMTQSYYNNTYKPEYRFWEWKTKKLLDPKYHNDWYLMDIHSGEAGPNFIDLGRDLGLKLGQKYPGYKAVKQMLQNYKGNKSFMIPKLNYSKAGIRHVWDAMTGKYFMIPATIGIGGATITNKYE